MLRTPVRPDLNALCQCAIADTSHPRMQVDQMVAHGPHALPAIWLQSDHSVDACVKNANYHCELHTQQKRCSQEENGRVLTDGRCGKAPLGASAHAAPARRVQSRARAFTPVASAS